jgi:hypothetical protein
MMTMRMNKLAILAVPVAALGCTAKQSTGGTGGDKISAAAAIVIPGDVVPQKLTQLDAPVKQDVTIQGSSPMSAAQELPLMRVPERKTSRDYMRIVAPGSSADLRNVPLDVTEGTIVIITVADDPDHATTLLQGAHLRAADGTQLDRARDPNQEAMRRRETISRAEMKQFMKDNPGMEPMALPRRGLSIDVPGTLPQQVMVDIPQAALDKGVIIDVMQPSSTILAGAVTSAMQYVPGETPAVTVDMTDAGAAIDGATVHGWLESPDALHHSDVVFLGQGNGQYTAQLPIDAAKLGVWTVHVEATGVSNGRAFEKQTSTTFTYDIPHAKMVAVGQPRLVTRDGMIDSIDVDVDVDSVQADRLGLQATLVVRDEKGVEHPIATAQTGQNITAGTSTMTLVFASKDLYIANQDGPYYLRDLSLTSFSDASLQHRLGRGLELQTPMVQAHLLRQPEKLTPGVEESLNLGNL